MSSPDLSDFARERFSPLAFDERHVIGGDAVEALLEAAGRAPSAGNSQPWAFVVGVRGDEVHQRMARHLIASERLPINPNGGQLGEAYIHGMNGIAEAVRQLRGTAVNQVAGAANVLVTAGTGVPTSGLVLAA